MNEVIRQLIRLQEMDSRILEKRLFIDKVPLRINDMDGPLKQARRELQEMQQKSDALAKKKKDRERTLEETEEKIKKMKARVSEIKTNKEYQAHLKEIESFEKEIGVIEEDILVIMEEMDGSMRVLKEKESALRVEDARMNEFKAELDRQVAQYEKELGALKDERAGVVASLPKDVYNRYMSLLQSGNGLAVTKSKNEMCCGCNMNIPPQLFVEIRKNEEVIQCPQCYRILYFVEEP